MDVLMYGRTKYRDGQMRRQTHEWTHKEKD